jgi:hypothetical protein
MRQRSTGHLSYSGIAVEFVSLAVNFEPCGEMERHRYGTPLDLLNDGNARTISGF